LFHAALEVSHGSSNILMNVIRSSSQHDTVHGSPFYMRHSSGFKKTFFGLLLTFIQAVLQTPGRSTTLSHPISCYASMRFKCLLRGMSVLS